MVAGCVCWLEVVLGRWESCWQDVQADVWRNWECRKVSSESERKVSFIEESTGRRLLRILRSHDALVAVVNGAFPFTEKRLQW